MRSCQLVPLVVVLVASAAAADAPTVLLPVKDERADRWGFVDATGRTVIPPRFASVRPFSGGLAPVCRELTPEQVDEDGSERTVYLASRWEYIDTTGRTVIAGPFGSAAPFSEGLAAVRVADGHYGYVDRSGRLAVAARFDDAGDFHDGRAVVRPAGRREQGAIDASGKLVVPAHHRRLRDFAGGRAAFRDGELWGFIDENDRLVIPARYPEVEPFSEGLAYVVLARKGDDIDGGYIDRAGKLVIKGLKLSGGPFREGLARVYGWNRGYWIDRSGRKVIAGHGWVGDFSEGLASFAIDGRFGYLDRSGKVVIAPQFASVEPFHGGVAVVGDVNAEHYVVNLRYIDRSGKVVARLSTTEAPPH